MCVYVYTCPCVDLAYSCIRAPVYTCEAGLLVPIGGFEAGLLVAYWWLRGPFKLPKSLPWLFRVSSGQSLSKSADGFQPFWVPFGGFEALFCAQIAAFAFGVF